MSDIILTNQTQPPTPGTGKTALYVDSTSKRLSTVDDAGLVRNFAYAGTYTPTLDNTTNVAASTAFACQYMVVGDVCTVGGLVNIDTTSTGNTVLGITLPVASALVNAIQLAGTAVCLTGENARLAADPTNDRVLFRYTATTTTNNEWSFTFVYRIV